ncbi:MAG: hypothetical protein AAGA45_02530 [Verrucomicrobiota bacterium]
MRKLSTLLIGAAVLQAATLSAIVINYNGTALPDDANFTEPGNPGNNASIYTTVVFRDTSWQVEDGFLKMDTSFLRGIWFGGHPSAEGDGSTFRPSNTTVGNRLTSTFLITPGSEGWDMILSDNSGYYAAFEIEATDNERNRPGISVYTGDGSTIVVTDPSFNVNVQHTYSMHIHDGNVAYFIDGDVVYSGPAWQPGQTNYYLLGDASGNTPTGSGSMWLSFMSFDNAAGAIPEPSQFSLLFALAALALLRLRR